MDMRPGDGPAISNIENAVSHCDGVCHRRDNGWSRNTIGLFESELDGAVTKDRRATSERRRHTMPGSQPVETYLADRHRC
jgi:hypothetical protein